ncbi:hypothetical protein ZWY2020_009753 [Hordeum vulgare]|nr:hypothetical protein ZWY2020_009753 [Hordeum vulgare]
MGLRFRGEEARRQQTVRSRDPIGRRISSARRHFRRGGPLSSARGRPRFDPRPVRSEITAITPSPSFSTDHLVFVRVSPGLSRRGKLIDDILVEIISRVPAKALYRCKCVSKYWLGLIHHPDHRKRLPQTLAGFFYSSSTSTTGQRRLELPFRYTSLSGDRHRAPFGASFTFLPNHHPARRSTRLLQRPPPLPLLPRLPRGRRVPLRRV